MSTPLRPRLLHPRWKLHARSTPFVFAFFMSSLMALLMCMVITGVNAGLGQGYAARVLGAYQLAMPAAFCGVLLLRPLVQRLVAVTVRAH
ncbi:MAG: hypothetical protein GAK31_03632 [Stenotrophomonas maltophilia]|uniref:DUF2798 domain-containing protein n=1 Tax=Stenotrophomonas maltophilia TaxID=40324 RepID=A0A7V8FE20_STEMA|nr:MAG: hypothetical protein GAK31_03632 [Stenotrophomonas maltophilia]